MGKTLLFCAGIFCAVKGILCDFMYCTVTIENISNVWKRCFWWSVV